MGQFNSNPCVNQSSGSEQRAVDVLLKRLADEVSTARSNSNDFYSKALRLSSFSLECDSEESEKRLEDPDGYLAELNNLINILRFINRRNVEILLHIDKIM